MFGSRGEVVFDCLMDIKHLIIMKTIQLTFITLALILNSCTKPRGEFIEDQGLSVRFEVNYNRTKDTSVSQIIFNEFTEGYTCGGDRYYVDYKSISDSMLVSINGATEYNLQDTFKRIQLGIINSSSISFDYLQSSYLNNFIMIDSISFVSINNISASSTDSVSWIGSFSDAHELRLELLDTNNNFIALIGSMIPAINTGNKIGIRNNSVLADNVNKTMRLRLTKIKQNTFYNLNVPTPKFGSSRISYSVDQDVYINP